MRLLRTGSRAGVDRQARRHGGRAADDGPAAGTGGGPRRSGHHLGDAAGGQTAAGEEPLSGGSGGVRAGFADPPVDPQIRPGHQPGRGQGQRRPGHGGAVHPQGRLHPARVGPCPAHQRRRPGLAGDGRLRRPQASEHARLPEHHGRDPRSATREVPLCPAPDRRGAGAGATTWNAWGSSRACR